MTYLDRSRIHDIEELAQEYRRSPFRWEKQNIEKKMYEILNTGKVEQKLRDNLINAVRANDRNAKQYFIDKLLLLRQNQLNGQQF